VYLAWPLGENLEESSRPKRKKFDFPQALLSIQKGGGPGRGLVAPKEPASLDVRVRAEKMDSFLTIEGDVAMREPKEGWTGFDQMQLENEKEGSLVSRELQQTKDILTVRQDLPQPGSSENYRGGGPTVLSMR